VNASANDTAVYPGSFDPFTHGHLDIVRRIRLLFSSVIVLVASNPNKQPRHEIELRAENIGTALPPEWDNVRVDSWRELTAEYCRVHRIATIIRGVRHRRDLVAELELAGMNRELAGVDTLLLPARPDLAAISSTLVRCGLGQ
jgi:pantetheine-phosphate adenylyltransferase